MQYFDASAPPPEEREPVSLLALQSQDAESRLIRALDHVADVVARVREREAEQGLDPELVAVMVEITSAPDASLELASLGRRVRDGFTTWEQVWADPGVDPAAQQLVAQAQRIINERATRAWSEAEPPQA